MEAGDYLAPKERAGADGANVGELVRSRLRPNKLTIAVSASCCSLVRSVRR